MNTFYELEGYLYENLSVAQRDCERHFGGRFSKIEEIITEKDFETFSNDYDGLRNSGNSIRDSLELAK